MKILNRFLQTISNYFSIFSKPYPAKYLKPISVLAAALLAVASYLLLNSLRPFGIDQLSAESRQSLLASVAMATFLIVLIFQFALPFILKSMYAFSSWTGSKQMVHLLVLFATISIVSLYLINKETSEVNFLTGIALVLIPVLILSLILFPSVRNMAETANASKAQTANDNLKYIKLDKPNTPFELLSFKGQNNVLNILPNQLLKVETNGNASRFQILEGSGIINKALEIDSKNIQNTLKAYSQFVKIESNVIVNKMAIKQVDSNASGFKISSVVGDFFLQENSLKKLH